MSIAIGCDHVALELKSALEDYLRKMGYEYEDFGTFSTERTDYPIYAEKVSRSVVEGKHDRGILICGNGVGMAIAANKVRGIRAVVCSEPYSAVLSRQHNDSNILAIGAYVVGSELAKMIVRAWLTAEYGGGRHQRRLDLIAEIERAEAQDRG